ncbi:MAG: hypothetical protein MI754_11165 [Chromatiales bacterium]|nr:hypothetical protein [Chromatiales bacterium]
MGILIIQIVLGVFAFFLFFAGMTNGHTDYVVLVAAVSLIVTCVFSYIAGKRSSLLGIKSTLAFATPALLFAVLSLADLLSDGNARPLLFWSVVALIAVSAGLVGVGIAHQQTRGITDK